MKIAVIGSGISGISAADWLSREHQVTLFEAASSPGGHVHTVNVELDGQLHAVDTGFIVYNEATYPHFTRLLRELDVATQPTSMSFSVRCDRSGVEYSGKSLAGLFAQPRNAVRLEFWRMLSELTRFNRLARSLADKDDVNDITLETFLREHRFSGGLLNWYLLPMGAAIWSCTQDEFLKFPLGFLLAFLRNHGLLAVKGQPVWRVIQGGSRTYVDRLLQRCHARVELRLATPVIGVRRTSGGALVAAAGRDEEPFDHVVFACHSDQALRLLRDPTPLEADTLGGLRYGRNVALLHTDCGVLPRNRAAWASWNYFIPDQPEARPRVTYCMNILQGMKTPRTVNVSLNCEEFIDPARVLKRIEYSHPLFDLRTRSLQMCHPSLINANSTSYCGAYWRNGFHEDGLVSARLVCERLAPSVSPSWALATVS